jgi:hypothetical protein
MAKLTSQNIQGILEVTIKALGLGWECTVEDLFDKLDSYSIELTIDDSNAK